MSTSSLVGIAQPRSLTTRQPRLSSGQVLGAVAQFEKSALVARLAGGRKRTGRTGGIAPLTVTQPAVVERVHQLRAADSTMTLRAIGAVLTEEGHFTSKGKPYNPAQIARITRIKEISDRNSPS